MSLLSLNHIPLVMLDKYVTPETAQRHDYYGDKLLIHMIYTFCHLYTWCRGEVLISYFGVGKNITVTFGIFNINSHIFPSYSHKTRGSSFQIEHSCLKIKMTWYRCVLEMYSQVIGIEGWVCMSACSMPPMFGDRCTHPGASDYSDRLITMTIVVSLLSFHHSKYKSLKVK